MYIPTEREIEELSALATKVYPGSFVVYDKWFDAPGHLQVLREKPEWGYEILLEMNQHDRMVDGLRAALLAMGGPL